MPRYLFGEMYNLKRKQCKHITKSIFQNKNARLEELFLNWRQTLNCWCLPPHVLPDIQSRGVNNAGSYLLPMKCAEIIP